MSAYLDTAVAVTLLIDEPGSAAARAAFADRDDIVSAWLLHTELHRAVRRRSAGFRVQDIDQVLASVDLVDLERGDLIEAAAMRWQLRTLDAIHLAVALRVKADEMITYDVELANAASSAGLLVSSPGR